MTTLAASDRIPNAKCRNSPGESLVQNVTFPDFDLDYDDLGGTLAWQKPADATQAAQD